MGRRETTSRFSGKKMVSMPVVSCPLTTSLLVAVNCVLGRRISFRTWVECLFCVVVSTSFTLSAQSCVDRQHSFGRDFALNGRMYVVSLPHSERAFIHVWFGISCA